MAPLAETPPETRLRIDHLLPIMSSPATGAALRREGDVLRSERGETYPLRDGVPVLIDEQRSVFRVADVGRFKGYGRSRFGMLVRWAPSLSRNVAAEDNFARLRGLLEDRSRSRGTPQRVLVVGGAIAGAGFPKLLGSREIELVETDISIGPRTRIVCDAHALPFVDGAFDAVVCQAVLEYVFDPIRVVAEIHRVLKPAGLVYSETPFLQQVHGGPYDFTRLTHLGHRRLYRSFDELRSGAVGGPGMTLAWAWRSFLIACGGRSRLGQIAGGRLAAFTAFWLPWLDGVLAQQPGGLDAACGTYFLGTRRESPVPDEEIVRGYRGAQSVPWER